MAVKALYNEGNLSVTEIAGNLGISKGTLYSYLRHERSAVGTLRKLSKIANIQKKIIFNENIFGLVIEVYK